jgi:hypothetical protein
MATTPQIPIAIESQSQLGEFTPWGKTTQWENFSMGQNTSPLGEFVPGSYAPNAIDSQSQ